MHYMNLPQLFFSLSRFRGVQGLTLPTSSRNTQTRQTLPQRDSDLSPGQSGEGYQPSQLTLLGFSSGTSTNRLSQPQLRSGFCDVNMHICKPPQLVTNGMSHAFHPSKISIPNTLPRGMLQIPKTKLHLPSFDCIKTPV